MTACLLLTAWLATAAVVDPPAVRTVQLPALDRGYRTEPGPLASSSDGKLVATVAGLAVSVWDSATGNLATRLHLPVEADDDLWMEFAADGQTLVTAIGLDRAVRWFDVRTGKQVRELNQPQRPDPAFAQPQIHRSAYVLGPGARWLVIGETEDARPAARVVDLATGKRGGSQKLYWYPFTRPVVTRDGKLVVNAHANLRQLEVWDVAAGKMLRTLAVPPQVLQGRRQALGVSVNGKYLAVNEGDLPGPGQSTRLVTVWGLDDGRLCCSLKIEQPIGAAFSADGWGLVMGTAAGVSLFDLRTEGVTPAVAVPDRRSYRPATPDGKSLVVLGTTIGTDTGTETLYLTRFPELPPLLPPDRDLSAERVAEWWKALGSPNEFRRRYAVQAFVARPEQAVAEIAARVKPDTAARRAMVVDLLGVLDDDKHETRDKAQAELQSLVRRFEPLLTAARDKAGPGEVRNRLTTLLTPRIQLDADDCQSDLSAVAVLEAVKTAKACRLLADLAGGVDGLRLTAEAKAALDRLKKAHR